MPRTPVAIARRTASRDSEAGVTLIEMMVVLVMISVVAALIVPVIPAKIKKKCILSLVFQ